MMMNQTIVHLVGLQCCLGLGWELDSFFGVLQNQFPTILILLLEMVNQFKQQKLLFAFPFSIGVFIFGESMLSLHWHSHILIFVEMHQAQLALSSILY